MVELSPKRSSLTPEEYAAKKAAQEAIFAKIYGDLDSEKAAKEQRTAAGIAAQERDKTSPRPVERNPQAVYINPTAVIDRIYADFDAAAKHPSPEEETVQYLYTASDMLVPTLPDISGHMPERFETAFYEHRKADTVIKQGEYLAVERTGYHYQLHVSHRGENTFGLELIDREEGRLTQKRLSGVLSLGTGEAEGRMVFEDDPDVFIHPSVALQKEASLRQVVTVLQEGVILDVTYPQES